MKINLCRYNIHLSILYCRNPISYIPLLRFWFHTLYPFLCPFILLRSLRNCDILIPPLVLIPWGIYMCILNSMLSWVMFRTNSNWCVLHPFIVHRTSTILMVKQVTIYEKVSNKFEAYSCFTPWTLRQALCLNTRLVFMSFFCLNSHTYGNTCYPFGTCSLGVSSQCFRSMWALTSLMVAFLNSLTSGAFMDCW